RGRVIRGKAPLHDGDGAWVDGRRLAPSPFRPVHLGQVVEGDAPALMLRPPGLPVDHQGAAIERLRLDVASLEMIEGGQVVETRGHTRMLGAQRALTDREGPAVHRLRLRRSR